MKSGAKKRAGLSVKFDRYPDVEAGMRRAVNGGWGFTQTQVVIAALRMWLEKYGHTRKGDR
jgi:hypothetical protein